MSELNAIYKDKYHALLNDKSMQSSLPAPLVGTAASCCLQALHLLLQALDFHRELRILSAQMLIFGLQGLSIVAHRVAHKLSQVVHGICRPLRLFIQPHKHCAGKRKKETIRIGSNTASHCGNESSTAKTRNRIQPSNEIIPPEQRAMNSPQAQSMHFGIPSWQSRTFIRRKTVLSQECTTEGGIASLTFGQCIYSARLFQILSELLLFFVRCLRTRDKVGLHAQERIPAANGNLCRMRENIATSRAHPYRNTSNSSKSNSICLCCHYSPAEKCPQIRASSDAPIPTAKMFIASLAEERRDEHLGSVQAQEPRRFDHASNQYPRGIVSLF